MNVDDTILEELRNLGISVLFADPGEGRDVAEIADDLEAARGRLPGGCLETDALLVVTVEALRAVSRRRPPANSEEVVLAAANTIAIAWKLLTAGPDVHCVDDPGRAEGQLEIAREIGELRNDIDIDRIHACTGNVHCQ